MSKLKSKIGIILSGLLFLLWSCESDTISPDQAGSFLKFFGNSFGDMGYDVKQTGDRGYILTGYVTNVSTEGSGQGEDRDMVLIKTDEYGNQEWIKTYGGELQDWGNMVEILPDGGFIALGTTTDTTLTGETVKNVLVVKTSANGDLVWQKSYGGIGNQEGNSLAITTDQGLILAGSTDVFRAPEGGFGENPQGMKDLFLLKMNQQGDSLWTVNLGYSGNDEAIRIRVMPDGGLIVLGNTDQAGPGSTGKNMIIVRTDASGRGPANQILGSTGEDDAGDMVLLPDGFLICGTQELVGLSRAFLMKLTLDIFASPVFEKYTDAGSNIFGNSLVYTDNDEIVLVGTKEDMGNQNIYFHKATSSGDMILSQVYGGIGLQSGKSVYSTSDGGFIITGGNEFDNNSMITLLKTDSYGELGQ